MGMVRGKPPLSTAVASEGRVTETVCWQRESSHEEKLRPTRMRLTCPSSLNKSFSEFHPISSVWNFCSAFGETGIRGHDFRLCIIHWVLSGETFSCEPSAELRAGMEVHNSKTFFFFHLKTLVPSFCLSTSVISHQHEERLIRNFCNGLFIFHTFRFLYLNLSWSPHIPGVEHDVITAQSSCLSRFHFGWDRICGGREAGQLGSSTEGELVDKEEHVKENKEHLGLWMKSGSSLLSPLIS